MRREARSSRKATSSGSRASSPPSRQSPKKGRAARTRARSGARSSQLMEERGGLVTRGRPAGLRGGLERAGRRRVPRLRPTNPGGALRLPLCARSLARAPGARTSGAGARARHRARRRHPGPAGNDEPHRAGRRRQRVRADDEPRPRLGRLPPRPRSPPEQHARGGRPADRATRARRADGEHDGARRWPSTSTGSRSQPERRAAPVCAVRCSRSSPGSSTRASSHRPPSSKPRLHPAGAVVHARARLRRGDDRRARVGGLRRCASGPAATTTSAASAPSRGTAPRAILVEAARLDWREGRGRHPPRVPAFRTSWVLVHGPAALRASCTEKSQERHRTVSVGDGSRALLHAGIDSAICGNLRLCRSFGVPSQLYVGLDLSD